MSDLTLPCSSTTLSVLVWSNWVCGFPLPSNKYLMHAHNIYIYIYIYLYLVNTKDGVYHTWVLFESIGDILLCSSQSQVVSVADQACEKSTFPVVALDYT